MNQILLSSCVVFVVLIAFAHGAKVPISSDQECDERTEQYSSCGPSCPQTCQSILATSPNRDQQCPNDCVQGCFCKNGLVRDLESTKCVESSQCGNARPGQEVPVPPVVVVNPTSPPNTNDDPNGKVPEKTSGTGAAFSATAAKWIIPFAIAVTVIGAMH